MAKEAIANAWNRNMLLWQLTAIILCLLTTGCVSIRSLPPYPSDWPATAKQNSDCAPISGIYANIGVQADANGNCTPKSLSRLLDIEDSNMIQGVSLQLGTINDDGTIKLTVSTVRDGTVIKTRILVCTCSNGEIINERADAALEWILMGFETEKKTFALACDGSLIIKSLYNGGGLLMFIPVLEYRAELFRFERLPDASMGNFPQGNL